MRINLKIECVWEPAKEKLPEFRDRYRAYQDHIGRLQLGGLLPRNKIEWEISKASLQGTVVGAIVLPPPDDDTSGVCCYPEKPAMNLTVVRAEPQLRSGPVLVHSSGRRLTAGWQDKAL